jgi:hypothetical protein
MQRPAIGHDPEPVLSTSDPRNLTPCNTSSGYPSISFSVFQMHVSQEVSPQIFILYAFLFFPIPDTFSAYILLFRKHYVTCTIKIPRYVIPKIVQLRHCSQFQNFVIFMFVSICM